MAVYGFLGLVWILSVLVLCLCDEQLCPKGAQIHLDSLRCYWLSAAPSSWPRAEVVCQRHEGSGLAVLDTLALQTFVQKSFPAGGSVWIGLKQVVREEQHQSVGLGQVNPQPTDRDQSPCTQLDLGTGHRRNWPCDRELLFICEKQITVSLPSQDSYVTGLPLMSGVYTLSRLSALSASHDIQEQKVEMMLFPGLWFSHEGQVLSVDLVAQPSEQPTVTKVQILRPYCHPNHHLVPPGCSPLLNSFSCCSVLPMCNTTGACPSGQYWCPLLEICLPVTSPCSPYHALAEGRVFHVPPRYSATPPFYHLVADVTLRVPPSKELIQINVPLENRGITVYPDDVLAIQHTRGAGNFLRCSGSSESGWRQSYLSLPGPEWGGWLEGGLTTRPSEDSWVDGVTCDVRVIYADVLYHYATPSVTSASHRDLSGTQTDSPVKPQSPVSEIHVVYPIPDKENQIHLLVNVPTLIVIKILSGQSATSSWSAPVSKTRVPSSPSCPTGMPESHSSCKRDTPDTWFSHVYVVLTREGNHTLDITVSSSVNSKSLTVGLHAHHPVSGLVIHPQGFFRVLVGIPQLFRATVVSGSSVKYTWVIDNLDKFAYTGEAYSVIFKKSAEYKLRVTAENPASSESAEVTLTADIMKPLTDLSFLSIEEVVTVNSSSLYTLRVKVDISIDVTIRWDFGDNSSSISHILSAPLERTDGSLDLTESQIYLQDSVNHTYLLPGDYTLRIEAHNKYDHLDKAVKIKVRFPLIRLLVSPTTQVLQVNQTFLLEASPLPSPYGIAYTWNFTDGSAEITGSSSKLNHAFKTAGIFNISICANNTLSALTTWVVVEVVEAISHVSLSSNGPSEVNSVTNVIGRVLSGTSLKWSFDFGDGFVLRDHPQNSASHIYTSPGSYTVQVTVANAVSSARQSINVEVYDLAISGILPSGCFMSGTKTTLSVLLTGNISLLTLHWSFGDGTPLSISKGISTISHTYTTPGIHPISVTAFSPVGSAHYQTDICIEEPLVDVKLLSPQSAVPLGEEMCFDVSVFPSGHGTYQFLWHNSSSSKPPIRGETHRCFVFQKEGTHDIIVDVSNKVSSKTAKATITAERRLSKLSVKQEGDPGALTVNKSYSFWAEVCCKVNVTVQWDFGDGSPKKEGQNQSHAFSSVGKFQVSVIAFNAVSGDSVTTDVEVQGLLSDLVIYTDQPFAEAGKEMLFTVVANDMNNVNFYWSVDSFTTPKLGTSEFRYVFLKAGVYMVKVTAQNHISQKEATSSVEIIERIQGVEIVPHSLVSMRYFPTQEIIPMTASVTQGTNLTYQWNIHQDTINNTVALDKNVQLFARTPGDVSIKLMVSNALNSVDSHVLLRAVERVSGVSLLTPMTAVSAGKSVRISAGVETGSDLQYLWFLDSGLLPVTSDVPFVFHVFRALGSFDIRVSISNVFGSRDATKRITVQEDVSEVAFDIDGKSSPFFVTTNSLVLLHGSVYKGKALYWEWTVSLPTRKSIVLGNNESVSYSFMDVGDYCVSLNASNDVSWHSVSHMVTAQDAIQGLMLNVSHPIVCENDPISFTPVLSQGSDVCFTLQFSPGNLSVDLVQNDFTTLTLPLGEHLVTVTAKNRVSSSAVSLTVWVVERIMGLHLVNCCSNALEASKEIRFQALVSSGSPTNYHWSFHLDEFSTSQALGRVVLYSPPRNGSLSIMVEADNGFCSQTLTERAVVQFTVREVQLVCSSDGAFADNPISFSAITDGGDNLRFKWAFGDTGRETLITESNSVDHTFSDPGLFLVHVTAFNNVSQASADLPVEVKRLECSYPEIYLIQEQSKIFKSRPSYFEARVDLKGCKSYKTVYLWEIFTDPSCAREVRISLHSSVDVSTPLLFLPKNTLEVGEYVLRFSTMLQGTSLKQHNTTRITVCHSPLVPLIKGGSHRVWSSHSDLTLDGTDSYDPDAELEVDDLLQFRWHYTVLNTTEPPVPSLPDNTVKRDSRTFILPSKALQPGRVYHFTLTVQKARRPSVSTTQSIAVLEATLIPVTVTCVSCRSPFSFHISHSRSIVLSGHSPLHSESVRYKWMAEDERGEALRLNEVTTSTGDTSPDLVIRPGLLQNGIKYVFSLNVTQPARRLWGSASITLFPNHPPSDGSCTITPNDTIHLLETMVSYSCSGWVDKDNQSSQLIYTLQVALCECSGPLCPMVTLYRGTQDTFGTLLPLGNQSTESNISTVTVLVHIEDNMGATVTPLRRNLRVVLPATAQSTTGWLKNRSQSELWALQQQGNPQDFIPYAVALTSQLNQIGTWSPKEFEDRALIRGNVTESLASLPISSLHDASQISSALALVTAVPSEVICEGCEVKVLKTTEKMIKMIKEQVGPGDITALDTAGNILRILSSFLPVGLKPKDASGPRGDHMNPRTSKTAVSALSQVGELVRSLMRTRMRGEEPLSLGVPGISAVGVRSHVSSNLLCTDPSSRCHFHVPPALSSKLRQEREEVVQILLDVDTAGTPFIPPAQPPISTSLAAMEFTTAEGHIIPVANLSRDSAIRVTLPNRLRKDWDRSSGISVTLPAQGSVNFTVKALDINPHAGLYLAFNFSLKPGTVEKSSGHIKIFAGIKPVPGPSQNALIRELNLSLSAEAPSVESTIFLTPLLNVTAQALYVNLSSSLSGGSVDASVCVFSSLCQFFSVEQSRWSSHGLSPLSETSLNTAHCLTRHLTAFGASLFVHPDAIVFLPPSQEPVKNMVVGIVCGVLLTIHLLVGLIAHKLDHLERQRLSSTPLCGQLGRYRYRVLVKTGWQYGSGTTAHVGIRLYGVSKSGLRHLQREGAFQRNSLDDFQVETDANLGEIWKISIWHDNTGLDPSWYLQHVVVWDMQTDNLFFFVVEDWLSVDREKSSGMVEKDVLASCPQELRQFWRVFRAQMVFGLVERHLWLSIWERPAHSSFSRAQRVACGAMMLHLYLAAGAVWYGAVGTKENSNPVSAQLLVNPENILAGMTVAAVMFPVQCILSFLFWRTRSKVCVDTEVEVPPSPMSDSVEMDVYLSHPVLCGSSFLSLPRGTQSSTLDGPSPFSESEGSKHLETEFWNAFKLGDESGVSQWQSCDNMFGLPEQTGPTRLLKRKRALLQLQLTSPTSDPVTGDPARSLTPQQSDITFSGPASSASSSASSVPTLSDSGRYSPNEITASDLQESSSTDWSELSVDEPVCDEELVKSPSSLSLLSVASTFLPSPPPDTISTCSNTRIGVARGKPGWFLPSWVLRVSYLLVAVVLGSSLAVMGLYGSRFSSTVVLMWLLSCLSAFFTSALLIEPLKVLVQALFLAAVVRPVDPEVEDLLAQEIPVRKMNEGQVGKVRPPYGYGLLQAREEARKVRTLRALMKSCMVHLLFLLVVLMVNYQETVPEANSRLLHSAVKLSLLRVTPGHVDFTALEGWPETWQWLDQNLVSHLYHNPSLLLVGLPRVQRVRFQDFCGGNFKDSLKFGSPSLMLTAPLSSHTNTEHQRGSRPRDSTAPLLSCEREGTVLGNSSVSTRQILSDLQNIKWGTREMEGVFVEFTQYHRETGLFVCVNLLLKHTQTDRMFSSVSILPFSIPSPDSGPDLHIALTVLLLLFALLLLGTELRTVVRERIQYLWQGWRWFQLLLALLSLATASLRLSFLSMATACLSEHVSKPSTFTDFYSAALLARRSSQFAAVLLTLLILKMVGTLRFVRRWVVFGRVLRQACREIGGAALLLVLLLLMFSHLGSLLFSGTVEGFRTQEQAGCSLLRLLRGRKVLRRLCKQHPVVGPLYCLSVLGTVFCVVGRLCGVVLVRMYATVKAEIHRPSIEPQDYEMVEFFIKRLKLWMGLSKTKEFRHRVQFEGMVSPPSRTSQASEKSRLSDSVSPTEPRLSSSASSLNSDTSTVSDSYDVQAYLERLLPCVDSLLEGFDRVNHLAGEVYIIELQLQEAQSRMASKQKMQEPHGVTAVECDATPLTSPPVSSPSSALPFVQAPPSCFHSTPPRRATHSESTVLQTSSHHIGSIKDPAPNVNIELSRFPRRRAWHSGICHSADVTQRSPRSRRSVSIPVRPRSEEGDRGPDLDCLPVKRTAWHPETSEAGRK